MAFIPSKALVLGGPLGGLFYGLRFGALAGSAIYPGLSCLALMFLFCHFVTPTLSHPFLFYLSCGLTEALPWALPCFGGGVYPM